MVDDQVAYWAARQDEMMEAGSFVPSPIPTYGAGATAVDQYRIVGIRSSNLQQIGVAFTDITAASALSKIAEGNVGSYADLEAAETALKHFCSTT